MKFFVEADLKVASNPVAKAIARTKLAKAMTHMALRIYSMNQGEDCADLLQEAAFVLALVGMAAEREPAVGPTHHGVRVIRGALSSVEQMVPSGKWDRTQAAAVEHGVNTAIDLNKVINNKHILRAWDDMKEMT